MIDSYDYNSNNTCLRVVASAKVGEFLFECNEYSHYYMKLSEFDYNLPPELIVQMPMEPRDYSRLLVYENGIVKHQSF